MLDNIFDFTFPKIGEASAGGRIVRWLKKEGEIVEKDEPLLEVSTDKIGTELCSPVNGTIVDIKVQEGLDVDVGMLLACILLENQNSNKDVISKIDTNINIEPAVHASKESCVKNKDLARVSPVVAQMLLNSGIDFSEIQHLPGSGIDGRFTKKDLDAFLINRNSKQKNDNFDNKDSVVFSSIPLDDNIVERRKMSYLRSAVADATAKSFTNIPHASLVHDIDVTALMKLIAKHKEEFISRNGAKLTITAFIVKALAETLVKYPLLNSSLDRNEIIIKKNVNIGIAVNINHDGIIVPVIEKCNERNLISIAKAISELSHKAREGSLEVSLVQNGSITLTNFGMSGAIMGIPVIKFPEAAILAVGAIRKCVHVLDDDSFAIRRYMYVTLTFDHRIIDGIYAGEALTYFKNRLESSVLID